MDDNDQMAWERFEEYVEETKDLLDPTISKLVKDVVGEENQMFNVYDHVINGIIKESRPLTFALATLETYETSLWDESMKKEIVNCISMIKEHCKNEYLRRHLSPPMLNLTYQTVYGYGNRLAEFDGYQQEKITEAIDSLYKYVVHKRRRS